MTKLRCTWHRTDSSKAERIERTLCEANYGKAHWHNQWPTSAPPMRKMAQSILERVEITKHELPCNGFAL